MKKIMFDDHYGLTKSVLDGVKTMTRRVITLPEKWHGIEVYGFSHVKGETALTLLDGDDFIIEDHATNQIAQMLPAYKKGDIIAIAQRYEDVYEEILSKKVSLMHAKSIVEQREKPGWNNKMFVRADLMPHQIRITRIKVEQLHDISEEECLREGVRFYNCGIDYGYRIEGIRGTFSTARDAFAALIDKISGNRTWACNPWVYVYEFELVR